MFRGDPLRKHLGVLIVAWITRYSETVRRPLESYRYHQITLITVRGMPELTAERLK